VAVDFWQDTGAVAKKLFGNSGLLVELLNGFNQERSVLLVRTRGLIFRAITVGTLSLVGVGLLTGCETKGFLDPTAVGRWEKEPLVVPILNNLDAAVEEANPEFLNATDVRQSDLTPPKTDYVIGPDDLLGISITDLIAPGVETVKSTRVSTSGYVSLPMVGQVKAAGLTEADLEKSIVQAYRDANIIQNAQVSVTVTEARNRTFSIIGSITQPGQYAIMKSDFRVLDALVLAKDTTFPDLDYLYIVRHNKEAYASAASQPAGSEPAAPVKGQTGPTIPEPGAMEPAPGVKQGANSTTHTATPATGESKQAADQRMVIGPTGKPMVLNGGEGQETSGKSPTTRPADVWAEALSTGHTGASAQDFEFEAPTAPSNVRVIRVPLAKLKQGDLRYNVVIRPDDMIVVPPPAIGEYYMGGHVARVGVYNLTDRKITLKQAVVAAGMLDGVAIPARTEVIRRVGTSKEVFVRVDLDKVFAGEQPDIYLKPNDVVNVGTNAVAPFLAALRGAFRFTYGFGFLYDRNFAYDNNNQNQ
jgi:polysaccharide export outer membrane protein